MPLESCISGHRALKSTGTEKPCTTAHENGQKCSKSRVLTMPLESCTGGHGASKSSRDPKTVDYRQRKRSEMPEIASFDDVARVMYGGSRGMEILPGPKKTWTIAHENSLKCPKSRNFKMPLESCIGGRGTLISSWDPKIMDYSPRKRTEMPEITSFDDAARVVYRG